MPAALLARGLVRVHGDRTVLDGVSLTAAPGRRIGLIGENGAGKSTLLGLLAGTEEPDAGSVHRPADLGLGAQELPWPGAATIADVLDDALRDARAAVAAVDDLAARLPERAVEYAEHLEWCQDHDAWDADRRADLTMHGLGLDGIAHDRTLGSLSGGQCSRIGLAALMVRRPDALLLDEPTNHLDDDAAAFLEEALRALPGVVVLASHDRAFLDAVCTDVVDLDPAVDGPTRYGGGYTAYLAERHAARKRWAERYSAEQAELTVILARGCGGVRRAHRLRPTAAAARRTDHSHPPCATSWRTRSGRALARSSSPATTDGCAAAGPAAR